MAFASSQARASARNAASSGVSSKSTGDQTRTRLEHVLVVDELLRGLVLGHLCVGATVQVLHMHGVQEPFDALDDAGGTERRKHVEGVLRARHLGVEDGAVGYGAEQLDELARVLDRNERVV